MNTRDEIIAFCEGYPVAIRSRDFMRREQPHMLRLFCVAWDFVCMEDLHAQESALSGWNRTDRTFTIIGELDAIGCKSHPMADPVNGTAHACGHHAQIAAMIGAALALTNEEVQASLSGSVSFLPFRRKNTLMQINVHGFGKRKSASRHPEKAS